MKVQASTTRPVPLKRLPISGSPQGAVTDRVTVSEATRDPKPQSALMHGLGVVTEKLSDFGHTVSALPKFIYPTVTGTPAQQALVWEALDSLPMHQAVLPASIEVLPSLPQGPNLLGVNRFTIGQIKINQGGWDMDQPWQFKETVIHEVGHSVDYPAGSFSLATRQNGNMERHIYGHGPYVSDYAETQPAEDFAETYKVHHTDPDQLQRVNPTKAESMRKHDQPHFLQRLVDNEAYRETGKFIGQQFQSAPILRSGLELARQVTVINLAVTGATQTVSAIVKGQGDQAVSGLLDLGAGVTLAAAPHQPWLGVAATAALGAKRGLEMAREQGASPSRQALASGAGAVGGTLGGFVAPLALVQGGYALAGPIGGTVGLVVGGILGTQLGSNLAASAALALTAPETQAA